MTKSERWILSEWQVAQDRELRFGERLIKHRERTPFAEIDLLFEAPGGLSLVEVKSWSGELWGAPLLSARQCLRLARAREFLEANSGRAVNFVLAVVSHERGRELAPSVFYFGAEALKPRGAGY